jgi:hypothetical protein
MISNIWWARNSVVFKDKTVPPEVIAAISISQAEEFKTELRTSKHCFIVPPPIDYTIPWGFFDGPSKDILLHAESGWFCSSVTATTSISDIRQEA